MLVKPDIVTKHVQLRSAMHDPRRQLCTASSACQQTVARYKASCKSGAVLERIFGTMPPSNRGAKQSRVYGGVSPYQPSRRRLRPAIVTPTDRAIIPASNCQSISRLVRVAQR